MTTTLTWRRVGREYHTRDGRFQIWCNHHRSNYFGSTSTWVLKDTATGRATQLFTRQACQEKAVEWKRREWQEAQTWQQPYCDGPADAARHVAQAETPAGVS